MTLFTKIKEDRINAFKEKSEIKKNILGCVLGDATKNNKDPDDIIILSIIKKFVNNLEFSLSHLDHNDNLYVQYSLEKDILNEYLPKQISSNELTSFIKYAISLGNNNIGSIMKYLKENYNGCYDGKMAGEIIKELLKDK